MRAMDMLDRFEALKPNQTASFGRRDAHNLWGDLKYTTRDVSWTTSLQPFAEELKDTHSIEIDGDSVRITRLA